MSLGLALVLAALFPLQAQTDAGPLGIALLRLEGPCQGARLAAGGPATEVLVDLGAGEVRTLAVPLELGPLAAPAIPDALDLQVESVGGGPGGGRCSIVGWQTEPQLAPALAGEPASEGTARALERLARRTRPPLAPARARASIADLALVVACACLVLALRRRPWISLAASSLGALALLCMPKSQGPALEVWVLEGDLDAGLWVEVRSGLGALTLEPGELAVPRTRPEGCARSYRVLARGDALRWWALAPDCELSIARRAPAPRLGADRNDALRLDPLWTRDPNGLWQRRRAWEQGRPLPELSGPGAPPAWLAAALPQGREVWVGLTQDSSPTDEQRIWLRTLLP